MIRAVIRRLDAVGYPIFAGFCVLLVAQKFYFDALARTGGEWSAPLDDVFIHFDFARSTARGYPFQWSEGNGYSSGNTSLTYPFILALGYWVIAKVGDGRVGQDLMVWAAIVACTSTFGFLLTVQRFARRLPPWARYWLPVSVLSVGALDWALLSGMEVAWFLGVWSVGLGLALDHGKPSAARFARSAWPLGLAGAVIVATRPEAATSVAILGITAGWLVWRRTREARLALATVVRAGVPAVLLLAVQAIVNRVLTGDFAAAGALTKLAYYNPYMTPAEKWDTYLFHLKYALLRNIEYHFADVPAYGWIPIGLAVVALLSRRTRGAAILLLTSAMTFILLVAMNGQVRWQNERYTMPAVAWLMVAAGLGLVALLSTDRRRMLQRATRWPRFAVGVALAVLFGIHQRPKMADQIQFFGRASRNIRDQHTTAGRLMRNTLRPTPRRVMVGDAGALIYASDLPGLDIIGLGGFHGLPVARSSVHGLGATVELLEHVPRDDLPDVMALYPTWWGKFPLWFGRHLTSVWVEDNVICGGAEKAIYAADWHLLNTGSRPSTLRPRERIADELDVADLLSEGEHSYEFPHPQAGYVDWRVLADPERPTLDVLDAGRKIPEGRSETFVFTPAVRGTSMRLVVRGAPTTEGRVEVSIEGAVIGSLPLEPTDRWLELSMVLSPSLEPGRPYRVALTPRDVHAWVNYHVWLLVTP